MIEGPVRVVLIEWDDHMSVGDGSWIDLSELHDLEVVRCESVGFLLNETENYYLISQTNNSIDSVVSPMMILKSCVKSYRILDAS